MFVALFLTASPAIAQDVTFSFSGRVTTVMLFDPDLVVAGVAEGTPFTGSFTFNLSQADSNPMQQVGDYRYSQAPYGVVVNVGSFTFRTDPANVDFLIEFVNDYHNLDNMVVRSYNNVSTGGLMASHISWQLDDPTQTALDSVLLPAQPPDLTRWQQWFGFNIDLQSTYGYSAGVISGTIEKIELGTGLIVLPDPTVVPGPAGPEGPAGAIGPTGLTGPEGPIGATGAEGPPGPMGATGSEGPQGPTGPSGPAGPTGPQGAPGPTGPQGVQGVPGPVGLTGDKGEGLAAGALMFLAAGAPAPAGYTYVGSFDLTPSDDSRSRGVALRVDMYRRN